MTLGSLLRLPGIRENTGSHGNAIPPHGTSTPSSKAVNSLTSSFCHRFSARVRQGNYVKGVQINVPTVAKALSAITTSIQLVGKSCPFKTMEDGYIIPIKNLIEGLQSDNPLPIPKLALPIRGSNNCYARGILSKSTYI